MSSAVCGQPPSLARLPFDQVFRLAERCVVEIYGPDHRGVLKYAPDRRRDDGLTLDGFAAPKFTNDDITDDLRRVATKRQREGIQL